MRIHPGLLVIIAAGCVESGEGARTGAAPAEPGNDTLVDDGDSPPPGAPHEVTACADGGVGTLEAALEEVAVNGTVRVCPGTYQATIARKPVRIVAEQGPEVTFLTNGVIAGFPSGNLDAAGWVTFEGFTNYDGYRCTQGNLRIVGGYINGVAHSGLDAENCRIELDGVTIADNRTDGDGGGAHLVNSRSVIRNSTFLRNEAVRRGGGLAVIGGTIEIRDSELWDNAAGGYSPGGAAYLDADAVVDHVFFINNEGDNGAGLYVNGHAARIASIVVRDNRGTGVVLDGVDVAWSGGDVGGNRDAVYGGGMRISRSRGEIAGVMVHGNAGRSGGGIHVMDSDVRFADVTVNRNDAGHFGGGIFQYADRSWFDNVWVAENRARVGGGMMVHAAAVTPPPSTMGLMYNVATDGGGIAFAENAAPLAIAGFTIASNTATRGAGIYTISTDLTVRNTYLRLNHALAAGGAIWAGANPDWNPCTSDFECPPVPAARPVRLELSSVTANAAPDGAAIWIEGPELVVRGAILADNAGTSQVAVRQAAPRDGAPNPYPTVTWAYSATYPPRFSGMPDPTGTNGNVAATCGVGEDGRVLPDTPCFDAGPPEILDADGTRADMGAQGGT